MCADKKKDPLSLQNLGAIERRAFLAKLGLLGISMAAARCGSNSFTSSSNAGASGPTGGGSSGVLSCVEVADETNGPYPADGTNTAGDGSSARLDKVYSGSPIVRSSIAEGMSGVPLLLNISLQNTNASCEALAGYYVYVWHCTAAGIYSAYSGQSGGAHSSAENYMRGIQQCDSSGAVSFTSIYPGWYPGRAIHIHVEIYRSIDDSSPVKTTQLAFPMNANKAVAALTALGYKGAAGLTDNSADGIFRDGMTTEMVTLTGDSSGYTATIALGLSV